MTILKPSSAQQINCALKNQSDPDRSRRVAARLNDSLPLKGSRILAQMEIYRRLCGVKEIKS